MNLVQINERLKDLPLQTVQQYANGTNPEVPAYLALAEIQRREKQMQQQNVAQGAAQGQPSVKEQIEQKSGLMALQQARMQQQQQQMMQPKPTGPVPPGIPEAEAQPEVEMAGGGVARLPVRPSMYRFMNGGIIAFQGGEEVPEVITVPASTSDEQIRKIQEQNPKAVVKREEAPMPTMPKGADYQRSPLFNQAYAAAAEMPEKPTPESVKAGIAALTPDELSDTARKQRYEAAEKRIADLESQYQKTQPSGLDRLIEVFGQAGQYKGLSGLGPAYTQQQKSQRARDLAFQQKQNEARTAMDKAWAEEAGGIFEARTKDFTAQNDAYQRRLSSRVEALAGLAGADQRAMDEAINRLSQMELTKLRIAADKANASAPGAGERITARILALKAAGQHKEAQALLDTYTAVTAGAAGQSIRPDATNLNNIYKSLEAELQNEDPNSARGKALRAQMDQVLKQMMALSNLAPVGASGAQSGEVDKTNPLLN